MGSASNSKPPSAEVAVKTTRRDDPEHRGFRAFAHRAAELVGSPGAFITAVIGIVAWAAIGPLAGFSDTWQLVVNTATTVITFLMVFLIQHTQNRDAKAIHLKLDELLRGVRGARTELVALEDMTDEELETLDRQFKELRRKKRQARGHDATSTNE